MAKKKGSDPNEAPSVLESLADNPQRAMQLLLWKQRMTNPDMSVQIHEEDVIAFDECISYQEANPEVIVSRPPALEAREPIPAAPGRRAVPGREYKPAPPWLFIKLVEKGTENGIRPVENNEQDFERAQEAGKVRRAIDNATGLAKALRGAAQHGEFSSSELQEAADALILLARHAK